MPSPPVLEVWSPKAPDDLERITPMAMLAELDFEDVLWHLYRRHEIETAALRAEIVRLESVATALPKRSPEEDTRHVYAEEVTDAQTREDEVREKQPKFESPKACVAEEAASAQPECETPRFRDRADGQLPSPSGVSTQEPQAAMQPPSEGGVPSDFHDSAVGHTPSDLMMTRGSSKKVQSKRTQLLSKYSETDSRDPAWSTAASLAETAVSAVILLNVVLIYVELEYDGEQASASLGHGPSGWHFPSPAVFNALSTCTTLFFLVELVLKLIFLRARYFVANGHVQKFNCFDALIVVVGALEQWVLTPLFGQSAQGANVESARMVRIFRLARTLRIFRTLEMFSKLRILVATTLASFYALFWSMVLISIVILISAFLLCQSLNPILVDDGFDTMTRSWVWRYYGTPTKSLWTIFEVTYSGGWPQYVRPLVEDVSPAYAFFFVMYISGVTFALFRIVTALFLKDTLSVANADTEFVIQEKMKEKQAYAQKLRDFFDAADTSGDGMLSWDEFSRILQDDRIKTYLASLELDARETHSLFEMLDDGDEQISIEEFVVGALRLKGQARSQDVIAILHDCSKLMRYSERIESMLTTLGATPLPPLRRHKTQGVREH